MLSLGTSAIREATQEREQQSEKTSGGETTRAGAERQPAPLTPNRTKHPNRRPPSRPCACIRLPRHIYDLGGSELNFREFQVR